MISIKVFYYTFGCKVNQYETENIRQIFHSKMYGDAEDYSSANICVVNSCTVTAQSDSKCRQLIHKIKKENPHCVVVLAGCFPQAFLSQAEKLEGCDVIVGTGHKKDIPQLTEEYIRTGQRIIAVSKREKGEAFEDMTNVGENGKTRAYIKIQDGCDQYCTYCIIPFARGHICSKSLDDIRKETEILVKSGHKEIILTGINLCCYGRDLGDGTRLIDAVEAACSIDGEYRVRLGSVEPELISDEDIERMSRLERLCPHFHLSLQSGCDKTLKAMNRHYSTAEFEALCKKLRRYFPNCGLTADIMVGFPNETEEDFSASLEFAKKIAFSEAHIFPYSRRQGTVADKMDGQLDKKTKHARAVAMAEVCGQCKKEYLQGQVGRTVKVLFERESSELWHNGHSPEYITVKVPRVSIDKTLRRKILSVYITSADSECCYGELSE